MRWHYYKQVVWWTIQMLTTRWRAIRSNLLSLLKFSRLYISAYQSCNFHQRPLCTTSTSQPASVCLPIILQSTTKCTHSEPEIILECELLLSCPRISRDLCSIPVPIHSIMKLSSKSRKNQGRWKWECQLRITCNPLLDASSTDSSARDQVLPWETISTIHLVISGLNG